MRERGGSYMLRLVFASFALGFFGSEAFVVPTSRPFSRIEPGQQQQQQQHFTPRSHSGSVWRHAATANAEATIEPLAFASGHSTNGNLVSALQEAVTMAILALPPPKQGALVRVDLAIVSVSSLYDGGTHLPATTVVPAVLAAAELRGAQIHHLLGSSCAGCISSSSTVGDRTTACQPIEYESIPAVSITLAMMPETAITTFHVSELPDDLGRLEPKEWKRYVGLPAAMESTVESPLNFLLLPSPAFSKEVDEFLFGLDMYFPGSTVVGGVASTVSSLSRAKLYQWSRNGPDQYSSCFTSGCIGIALQGDVEVQSMTAQGAKAVGGVYQILKGKDSTISVIVLDETATDALEDDEEDGTDEEDEEDEDEEEPVDARAAARQTYAKARIPKPVLAEANFLMKTLSDDDQAFMRRQLLIGLEQQQLGGGAMTARTASELARLATGQGHRFTVQQVAQAGMKDGSVTLPLGSVQVVPGTRMRFFVRESEFARKEVEALWIGYKKRLLGEQFSEQETKFTPAACWMIPTLDRGSKFFSANKPGYESSTAARMMPSVPCIAGFFSNGVIVTGKTVQGSASGYFLLGSKSGRPLYVPSAKKEEKEEPIPEEKENVALTAPAAAVLLSKAPRSADGELILKRREVHSGRALTVSTVEWSVAEKMAIPTSSLEGYMWDKETEVDRFRERVPLSNLVSQWRLSALDPESPKPRDLVTPILQAAQKDFVVIPELKQTDPVTGSLQRHWDIVKQTRAFTAAGVPAMTVNCDGIKFGGSLEDIQRVRDASSLAAVERMSEDGVVVPPLLALDLILYPYQLYKLRLAGADAVNLVTGALAPKDIVYLTKIASSLQFQVFFTVTSEVQLRAISALPAGSVDGVILSNRELEDFSFDMTGDQALLLLKSEALVELREKHGDIPVLVQGRVGVIDRDGSGTNTYLKEIKEAGATGAIVGAGLAGGDPIATLQSLQAA
jgi:indole-3-glycerol phosphate synthase